MHSFPNLETVCCSMSSSNCCFLTYIQVSQEAGKVVRYSHLLKHFPQFVMIHTVKSFGIVNEAEVGIFLEFSGFFYDPADVGNLISGSSAFSKSRTSERWSLAWRILSMTLLVCEMNAIVVWIFFSIAFLWDWNENWLSPVLWPLLSFPNLLAYWVQHFHSIIF